MARVILKVRCCLRASLCDNLCFSNLYLTTQILIRLQKDTLGTVDTGPVFYNSHDINLCSLSGTC